MPRQRRPLLLNTGLLRMHYKIGQLRERAFHKRRHAGDIRAAAETLSTDHDRELLRQHAQILETEAARLDEQASQLAQESKARRPRVKKASPRD